MRDFKFSAVLKIKQGSDWLFESTDPQMNLREFVSWAQAVTLLVSDEQILLLYGWYHTRRHNYFVTKLS